MGPSRRAGEHQKEQNKEVGGINEVGRSCRNCLDCEKAIWYATGAGYGYATLRYNFATVAQ
eukprot:1156713-Pelagomonas_calceolata.AAC.4